MPLVVDAVLFDMDGVLVDVSGSYRQAIRKTVRSLSGCEVSPADIQAYKNRGGYNDDCKLSAAMLRDLGAEKPFAEVVKVFDRHYRGENWDGLITREPAAITADTLQLLESTFPMALVTGRPEVEARWTLVHFGWEDYFPVAVTQEMQDGRGKPDPFPLQLALDKLAALGIVVDAGKVVYVGDAVDDIRAANALGCYSVGVIPPGVVPADLEPFLSGAGASVILSDVNALPQVLQRRTQET